MNNQLSDYVQAFVCELVRNNVDQVVISPGSRSTPLAIMIAEHPDINVWINIDERSAAFFALGIAKATKKTVAILCTSGTAAANYYPAIVEANLSRVPLLVLTADRPHELRDNGAPQTIDQINLYGNHVKWFNEMSPPDNTDEKLRYVRTIAARAVHTTLMAPVGPVHLNFPFHEPLIPNLPIQFNKDMTESFAPAFDGNMILSDEALLRISSALREGKGIIVCGPQENNDYIHEVVRLAKHLQFPILADPLSQLRSADVDKEWIVEGYDAFLREEEITSNLKPNVIIRFGALPVSKPLFQFLKKQACKQFVIDEAGGWRNPTLQPFEMIFASPKEFCISIIESISKNDSNYEWAKKWMDINKITTNQLMNEITKNDFIEHEGQVSYALINGLPEQSALFIGNSMPIRDIDTFLFRQDEKEIKLYANRGANGIDGIVSSALGVSTTNRPLFLLIGDLSLFHDLNGLLMAKTHRLNMTVILINNDGGGIFSFLPQADAKMNFEQLFGTPTGLEFERVANLFDATYKNVSTMSDLTMAIQNAANITGLNIIEVNTDRNINIRKHRAISANVKQEITKYFPSKNG